MALQINGTTVVNNSRQLQNIASVDTTTKNAIEAAGIGGFSIIDTLYTNAPSGGNSLYVSGGNIQGTGFTAGSTGVIGIYNYTGSKSNRAGIVYTGSNSWFTNSSIPGGLSALIHKGGGTTQWVGPASGFFYLAPNASITAASTDTRQNFIYYQNI